MYISFPSWQIAHSISENYNTSEIDKTIIAAFVKNYQANRYEITGIISQSFNDRLDINVISTHDVRIEISFGF